MSPDLSGEKGEKKEHVDGVLFIFQSPDARSTSTSNPPEARDSHECRIVSCVAFMCDISLYHTYPNLILRLIRPNFKLTLSTLRKQHGITKKKNRYEGSPNFWTAIRLWDVSCSFVSVVECRILSFLGQRQYNTVTFYSDQIDMVVV